MTVEEGVKLVISGGIVSPPDARSGARAEPEKEGQAHPAEEADSKR